MSNDGCSEVPVVAGRILRAVIRKGVAVFMTTARLKVSVAVLGSVLLGYQTGDEILVEVRNGRYFDQRGLELQKEWLDFDL